MAILKDLIVHGSSRFLNKIYASEIQTPLIDAESGIIKKLKADDVTVVGLLDVQGQMHTSSWTNSNIATIDGSFYITPTIECASGTLSSLTINTSTPPKHSFVLTAATGSSFAVVNSLYYYDTSAHTVTWAKYSKVLITGEILVGGEWIPLGTILGQLNADGASGSISIFNGQNNKHGTSTVLTELTSTNITSAEFRNLKISLYQRSGSTTTNTDAYKYPLGIYLTALGQNGKTFLDIYGGVNVLTTSYGGYANPNVRIGNLSGLPTITTAAGNFTPVGWGIYTTNGYFSGTIVSNTGVIGGWKLGASSLFNGTTGLNNTTEGIYLGTDGIRNYKDANTYVNITEGVITAKGVNLTGQINATAGNIGGASITDGTLTVPAAQVNGELTAATINGSKITANTITADQIAASAITTDELAANAVTSAKIKAGEVKADNIAADAVTAAKINVDNLSAISASMGTLTSGTISYGTVGSDSSFYLSSSDTSVTIAGASRTGLRLTVGSNFGVSNTGILYVSSAIISGAITATSLSTGTKTASTTGKGTFINSSGAIYVGNGSTNNFTVSETGTITATGANLLTATIGNATNKISIGTGTSGHSSIRYGMTTLADTSHDGFYIGTDGIALGKGKFKVTAAGAITATSLSIEISQVTDLQTTLNGKQAVGYITDMSNNGVFVHEKSNLPVAPTSSNANGVQITSNVDIIRGGESVAQYGSNARIGKNNEGRLVITSSNVTVYGKKNEKALSFGSTNDSSGVATVTEYLEVYDTAITGVGNHTGASLTYTPISVIHCYKNDDETTDISMTLINEINFAYNDSALIQGDYIKITYTISDQISYLELGYSSSAIGANSMAIGEGSISSGSSSLAVGYCSEAIGKNSISFGYQNQTFAENSFSSGMSNIVKGNNSVAFGAQNTITQEDSFIAGADNIISGLSSAAFGHGNVVSNNESMAFGNENIVSGMDSGAVGRYLIVNGSPSFACGEYNVQNSNIIFAVGNGIDSNDRSDAFWVSNVGNIGFTGIAYAGQPSGADRVPLFATGTGTATITINGNTTSPTAQSINIAKTGYTPWAINGIDITSPSCNLYRYFIEGNKLYYRIHNTSSSNVSVTITARISYIATSALSSS